MNIYYKVKNAILTLMAVLTLILAVAPTSVLAAEDASNGDSNTAEVSDSVEVYDTGDAIQDILQDDRFQGAMSSIRKITDFIDIWFIRIISIVSFFIISSSLLKNVCAAAYVSNSKFWDKVDEAHKKRDALSIQSVMQFAQGQGFMQLTPANLGDFIYGIIPNIKGCTEFDDADMEPKAYFMKSIPQMCACVCIGVFIYNGYYRDTAATVGNMGAVIVERVLTSVSPEAFLDKLLNTTGWPDFPTKNDSSKQGKAEYAISRELRSVVSSVCSDVTSSNQKTEVVGNIANAVRNTIGANFDPYYADVEAGDYEYSITGIKAVAGAQLAGYAPGYCEIKPEDSKGNVPFQLVFDLKAISGGSMDVDAGNNCVYVTGYFKKSLAKGSSTGKSDTKVVENENEPGYSKGNALECTSTVAITAKKSGTKVTFDDVSFGDLNFILDGESVAVFSKESGGKTPSAGVQVVKVGSTMEIRCKTQVGIGTVDQICLGTFQLPDHRYVVLYVPISH